MSDRTFWQGKRVFVTGHTGFKGSWLGLWLQSMGAKVIGYALAPDTEPNLFETANVANGMTSIIADINDAKTLHKAMNDAQPEIVLHLAAQALVRPSYDDPVETFTTNIMGTVNVLDAMRATKSVRAAMIVTSDKCYENKERSEGYKEDEALGGRDPYSASKACAEIVAASYRDSFLREANVAVATARAGNVIGGGDWSKDRLVPDILAALQNNDSLTMRNPDAVRPWQHVLEPLSGYILLAERLYKDGDKFASAWNFGPTNDDIRPVKYVAERLTQSYGAALDIKTSDAAQPHEAKLLSLDSTKAHTQLGWQPQWGLDRALSETAVWHKAWIKGTDMHDFCLGQIVAYTQNTESKTHVA